MRAHVPEVASLHTDVGPLPVPEPRHVVRRADMDVVLTEGSVELTRDGLRLRDLLGLETVALQHVAEVHVAADIELVGTVEHHPAILEQTRKYAVDDRGPDLALDVVTDDGNAGGPEPLGPLRVARDEYRDGVHERHAGLESGRGVVLLGNL